MSEDDEKRVLLWKAPPPRQPKSGEPIFEFVRASDGRRMVVELRFNGECEAQLLEDGIELSHSRGLFITRALAIQWAELEREALTRNSSPDGR